MYWLLLIHSILSLELSLRYIIQFQPPIHFVEIGFNEGEDLSNSDK